MEREEQGEPQSRPFPQHIKYKGYKFRRLANWLISQTISKGCLDRMYKVFSECREQVKRCRLGEAANPGPDIDNKRIKQRQLGEVFNNMHISEDDKYGWCEEKRPN